MADRLQIGPDIWQVEGPAITAALGFHYPTRMIVIRLPDGGLWVWSPIAALTDLSDLGDVTHLIAPNSLHHMSLGLWKNAHPAARIYAAKGVAAKQPILDINHTLTDTAPDVWAETIEQVVLPNKITTEVVFFHKPSGAVIFTDILQNMPPDWYKGWRRWVAKADLMLEPVPTVPRKFRLGFTDKASTRRKIDRIKTWPAKQIIMAHGTPTTANVKGALSAAFDWL